LYYSDALEKTRDRYVFESMGGKAEMTEAKARNACQRSTYTKAGKMCNYQSPASYVSQSSASISKTNVYHSKK
jgi:hypothetical protein